MSRTEAETKLLARARELLANAQELGKRWRCAVSESHSLNQGVDKEGRKCVCGKTTSKPAVVEFIRVFDKESCERSEV